MRNRSIVLLALTIALFLTALNGCKDASLQSIQPTMLGIGFNADGSLEVGTLIANGFRSYAFPAATSTLVVQGANTEYPVSLVVVNNSSESKTVTLGAEFSSSNGNVVARNVGSIKANQTAAPTFRHHELDVAELTRVFRNGNFQPFKAGFRASIQKDVAGEERSFYVTDTSAEAALCVQTLAHPSGTGQTFFYAEKSISDTRLSQFVSDLVLKWPSIFSKNRETFGLDFVGTLNGATFTEDITIFILSSGTIDPYGAGYLGFFNPRDFDPSNQYCNKRKIFYVRFLPENPMVIQSTLAHEFAHLIYYSQKGTVHNLDTGSPDAHFETEAMAGYAEHVNGYGIPAQSYDLTGKARSFLASHDKYRLDGWDTNAGTELSEYGKAYLFGTWFGQKFGVNGSLKDLVAYPAVGQGSFSGYSRKSFEDLQKDFSLSLFINDYAGSSIYGIKDVNLQGTYVFSGGTITLSGPKAESYSLSTSKSLTLLPYTTQYLNFYTSGPVTFTLPTTPPVYELHR